jgi:hypothetical protein
MDAMPSVFHSGKEGEKETRPAWRTPRENVQMA